MKSNAVGTFCCVHGRRHDFTAILDEYFRTVSVEQDPEIQIGHIRIDPALGLIKDGTPCSREGTVDLQDCRFRIKAQTGIKFIILRKAHLKRAIDLIRSGTYAEHQIQNPSSDPLQLADSFFSRVLYYLSAVPFSVPFSIPFSVPSAVKR